MKNRYGWPSTLSNSFVLLILWVQEDCFLLPPKNLKVWDPCIGGVIVNGSNKLVLCPQASLSYGFSPPFSINLLVLMLVSLSLPFVLPNISMERIADTLKNTTFQTNITIDIWGLQLFPKKSINWYVLSKAELL